MQPYLNLSGASGVSAYLIGDTFIKVRFKTAPKVYVYSHTNPGSTHVDRMKQLAIAGSGLSTYISQHVKKNYASIE